jgi:hypothetical protein
MSDPFDTLYRALLAAERARDAADIADDFRALRAAERECMALESQLWELEHAAARAEAREVRGYYRWATG